MSLLREKTAHFLLLTATPHKGDPTNFSLFLQLLDQEAYADVKSIHDAMERREAACYLRRTKEVMLNFPKPQPDGTWKAVKLFKARITKTVPFTLEGEEMALYQAVTHYVQRQSTRAAESGDERRARAVGFIMAMYQRRMASSTHSLKQSLLRRQKALKQLLETANRLGDIPMPDIPSEEEWDEMDDAEREVREHELERATLARRKPDLEAELKEIAGLIDHAQRVEDGGLEIKLSRLKAQLTDQGIFADPNLRLLIFTEYKDTLDYLVAKFKSWNLTVGRIHGSMKPGRRDEEGTRLWAERNFWDLKTQVLVATEAAGEGINLHCCHVLFNYDIPWNPNRLEQRMGRIHRYGQTEDCLIFNFFAQNTVEGRVLQKLVEKLQQIRDALDDDAVFNVVGEVLPSNQIERLLRDFYAGKLSADDLEARLEVEVREEDFRRICQSALEGLAKKNLNLPMLVERRALAQERRIVPETVARFFELGAKEAGLPLTPLRGTGVPPVNPENQASHGRNPFQPIQRRQGAYLPHWTQENATYAVNFRLFDALPADLLQGWLAEREGIVKTARQMGRDLTDHERERLDQLHSEKVEQWLDGGHGSCLLRNERVAELVVNALRFFDGQRYELFAWCLMPNHAHVVFRPFAGWTLPQLLHSWKSYTSKEANRILGRSGEFWQDEYYDHLVRNESDFERQVRYVLENPSKAGLSNWSWLGRAAGLLPRLFPPGAEPDKRLGQDGQATAGPRGTGVPPVRLGQDAQATMRAFAVGKLPVALYDQARAKDWRLPRLAKSYDRICFDRSTLETDVRLEWVTPGHPLFEAVRRQVWEQTQPQLRQGAVFYELEREQPALLELFIAGVADGMSNVLHRRLFLVETEAGGTRRLREPTYLLDLIIPEKQPQVVPDPWHGRPARGGDGQDAHATDDSRTQTFLFEKALQPFRAEIAAERQHELDLIEASVRACFEELIKKRDAVLSKHLVAQDQGDPSAVGLAESEAQKLRELQRRRDLRLTELARQRSLSLQGVERIGLAVVMPHPERNVPAHTNLKTDPETERKAVEAVIAFEKARGCKIEDVQDQNLGFDLRSLHPMTGELRLIEVKGIGAATGTIFLSPNEKRIAEDRRDLYWLYIVTHCDTTPKLEEPIKDPARFPWHEVKKIEHYRLDVNALAQPLQLKEDALRYGTP